MCPLWQRWQSLLAILLFFLNVDFILMPWATTAGLTPGWWLFALASTFAIGEPCYWNWYAKWLVRNVKRSERGRRVTRTLIEHGILARLIARLKDVRDEAWDWFVEYSLEHVDTEDAEKQRMLEGALSLVRSTHIIMTYPLMLGLGLIPAGWPFAIFVQRIFPVPGAFVVFLIANALKTYILGLLYLWLPWWAKVSVLLGALVFSAIGIRKVVRNVKNIRTSATATSDLP